MSNLRGDNMNKTKAVRGSMLALALLLGGLVVPSAVAQKGVPPPAQNVSGKRHPNLAAAQRLTDDAYHKLEAAQQANEFDMDGHAAKAKELLDQASREMKMAAEAANKNHK
jgi:hypothetical protein